MDQAQCHLAKARLNELRNLPKNKQINSFGMEKLNDWLEGIEFNVYEYTPLIRHDIFSSITDVQGVRRPGDPTPQAVKAHK